MSIIYGWTESQWIVFAGLSVAGLSALGLASIAFRTVRRWTAPATYAVPSSRPRPSIEAATRRTLLDPPMSPLVTAAYETADPGPLLAAARRITEPAALAQIAPGVGSITSTLAEEGVFGPRDDRVDADLQQLFGDWYDSWQRSVNAVLAPAMLKAITWAIEGAQAGVSGAAGIQEWYAGTETGEWGRVSLAKPQSDDWHPYATAH